MSQYTIRPRRHSFSSNGISLCLSPFAGNGVPLVFTSILGTMDYWDPMVTMAWPRP